MDKCYREEIVGVFGDPVDENPTVVVAHAAFEQLGIPYRYVNFNVKPENLEDAFKGLLAMQFKGIHLTIPHKVAAIPMLDSISEEAAIMGAVNTTDIGLFPNVDAKPDINFDCITPAMIVADIIPNHPITQLIKEAEKRGATTLDGLGMLINQCVESIYDWTGETPDAENMKKALAKEYGLEVHI